MSFDETIIHCGAPALCGIKPACLFSLSQEKLEDGSKLLHQWRSQYSKDERYFIPVKKADGRYLLFVYDKNLLEKLLEQPKTRSYLASKGYCVEKGLSFVLSELLHRLACAENFPHEVGIFLGYPLEDVIGFEKYGASGFKYSGIWKVYGNTGAAIRLMERYKRCTDTCMKLLASGLSVPLATKKYTGGTK